MLILYLEVRPDCSFCSHVKGRVLVALADGTVAIFHRASGYLLLVLVIAVIRKLTQPRPSATELPRN